MAVTLIFLLVVVVPLITTIYLAIKKSLSNEEEILPNELMPAGLIHLFKNNEYLESSPDNPYYHPRIDWSKGRWACVPFQHVNGVPDMQRAMVGTIRFLKPDPENGEVMVIVDNKSLEKMGYEPLPTSDYSYTGRHTSEDLSF